MGAKKSFHILINKNAGEVMHTGIEPLRNMLAGSPLNIESLHFLSPEEVPEKMKNYHNTQHPVLIGGGDGTIKSCAMYTLSRQAPFGILPLGTMNLLARDLDIPVETEKALNAYAQQTTEILIDVGMVNNSPFLCCVGLGTMPETTVFREEYRKQSDPLLFTRLAVFVLRQMNRLKQRRVRISVDGRRRTIKTAALVVSNNQYGSQEEWMERNFKRRSLQDGNLGVYSAAPASLWDRLRLLLRLGGLGNWKADKNIAEWQGETVSLNTPRKEELLTLDGEIARMKTPLNFWIKPKSLPLLVPQQPAGAMQ